MIFDDNRWSQSYFNILKFENIYEFVTYLISLILVISVIDDL